MRINPKVNFKSGLHSRWKALTLFMVASVFVFTSFSCVQSKENAKDVPSSLAAIHSIESEVEEEEAWELAFRESKGWESSAFEFPVGAGGNSTPKGYYNAQGFGENMHLGDDWNGTGGGNSDLGDPVNAISSGWVRRAEDLKGGWGKVVRIVHLMVENGDSTYIESVYAHLDEIHVEANTFVEHRQEIGSIGNADGAYLAHLHLEIRKEAGLPIGGGYSTDTIYHYDPSVFIKNH